MALFLIRNASLAILNLQFNRMSPYVVRETNGRFIPIGETRTPAYEYLWYDGETAMHIAVAKDDPEILDLLIARRVSHLKRAYGSFFAPQPEALERGEPLLYFGEYALQFAVSCGLNDVAKQLMQAYPDAIAQRDSFGNTAFHMAIIHRRFDTYTILVENCPYISFQDAAVIHGAMGLTPLAMAAMVPPDADDGELDDELERALRRLTNGLDDEGEEEEEATELSLFRRVLNTTREVAWSFSSVKAYTNSLMQIDTLVLQDASVPNALDRLLSGARRASNPAQNSPSQPPEIERAESGAGYAVPPAAQARHLPATFSDDAVMDGAVRSEIESVPRRRSRGSWLERLSLGGPWENEEVDIVAEGETQKKVKHPVKENTNFRAILNLTMSFNLFHMLDEDILDSLMDAKWHVVRWVYYLCMAWQFVFVLLSTLFAVVCHPKFADRYSAERNALRSFVLVMSIAGLLPTAYDVMSGLKYYRLIDLMVKHSVKRSDCPRQLELNPDAWEKYKAMEIKATPVDVSGKFMHFPMSGFDLLGVVAFILLIISQTIDSATDYPTTNYTDENPEGEVRADTPVFLVFLGMSAMCTWWTSLTFAPISRRLGTVVTMMVRTLHRDVVPFVLIFVVILGGSTVGAYSLVTHGYSFSLVADILAEDFFPTADSNMRLKNGGPGEEGPEHGRGASRSVFILLLFFLILFFSVAVSLLMLNLFIAALTSTYEEVKARAHHEWKLEWGRDVLLLERRMLLLPLFCKRMRMNHGDKTDHTFLSMSKPNRSGGGGGDRRRRTLTQLSASARLLKKMTPRTSVNDLHALAAAQQGHPDPSPLPPAGPGIMRTSANSSPAPSQRAVTLVPASPPADTLPQGANPLAPHPHEPAEAILSPAAVAPDLSVASGAPPEAATAQVAQVVVEMEPPNVPPPPPALPAANQTQCGGCGRLLEFPMSRFPIKVQCFHPDCGHVTRVNGPTRA
eukprot:TRINITY_DN5479_c1_g2_i1.p1 TRINITY_DN5479_c1_g2~~TRINITY_DN5479_c1_g2_i1.p1  ORF type:complete len:1048 (+),score=286.53 TRINITY_DN5479_c1_g2_i1:250-3144(+)